jgi:oligopeptide/dipeptide ABC transporter ATP-binding protein
LFGAIPLPKVGQERKLVVLEGSVPSPIKPPPGCRFHTRCPLAAAICTEQVPELRQVSVGRFAACHFVPDIAQLKD